MEVDGHSGFFQLGELGFVVFSPDGEIPHFLFLGLDIVCYLGIVHEDAAGRTDGVFRAFSLIGNLLGSLPQLNFIDGFVKAVYQIQFSGILVGFCIHRFHAAGNIHQPQFLDFLQQVLLLSVQQNEGVFGHGSNHTCSEASSSSAWRFFTILEEALERFSSSSM